MELTESVAVLRRETAQQLRGSARQLFMARTVRALGQGGQSKAERELVSGITRVGAYGLRGRKPAEAHLPHLLDDIRVIADGQSPADPQFRSRRLYTRLSAPEVRRQLIAQKGYTDAALRTAEYIRHKLNALGYTLRRVAKTQPPKSSRRPTPSSPR